MSAVGDARAVLARINDPSPSERPSLIEVVGTLSRLIDYCERLSITEPKSSVRWEYGVQRDEASAMGSRDRAEREIERQRSRKHGYRITGQRLVRRLISEWEAVPDGQ